MDSSLMAPRKGRLFAIEEGFFATGFSVSSIGADMQAETAIRRVSVLGNLKFARFDEVQGDGTRLFESFWLENRLVSVDVGHSAGLAKIRGPFAVRRAVGINPGILNLELALSQGQNFECAPGRMGEGAVDFRGADRVSSPREGRREQNQGEGPKKKVVSLHGKIMKGSSPKLK